MIRPENCHALTGRSRRLIVAKGWSIRQFVLKSTGAASKGVA
jgi:hypothetical protein